jgi:hypothetical protein
MPGNVPLYPHILISVSRDRNSSPARKTQFTHPATALFRQPTKQETTTVQWPAAYALLWDTPQKQIQSKFDNSIYYYPVFTICRYFFLHHPF